MILTEAEGRCIPQCEQLEFIPCGQELQNIHQQDKERRLSPAHIKIRYHTFLILEVKETFLTGKLFGGQNGSDAKSTHRPLQRDAHAHGRVPIYTKYRLRPRQIKMTGQRKLGTNAP